MIPVMPALIPTYGGRKDFSNQLSQQVRLVRQLKKNLLKEQKKLEILWMMKHKNRTPHFVSTQSQVNTRLTSHFPNIVSSPIDEQVEEKRCSNDFKSFWSFYETLDDVEEDHEAEHDVPFSIEDLVVEEVTKYRSKIS